MNKRLRKKHRRDEFAQHGVLLQFTFPAGATDEAKDAFLDRLVGFVEARGFTFGGGGDQRWDGFVSPVGAAKRWGTMTAGQREELERFLAESPELESSTVGPLVDAWGELPFAFAERYYGPEGAGTAEDAE